MRRDSVSTADGVFAFGEPAALASLGEALCYFENQ
jgi:hypothetical protein